MNKVITEPIFDINKDSSKAWAIEQARIKGNKKIRILLEGVIDITDPATQDQNILMAIRSQLDETGNPVTKFTYDDSTQLLTPTEAIDNIVKLEFQHEITYTGSNQSGGSNDANNVVEVVQLVVAAGVTTNREVDRLSSALDLPANETLIVPKTLTPPEDANPTVDFNIDPNISVGWALKSSNNPVVRCSNLQVIIDINYYDPKSEGGNDV